MSRVKFLAVVFAAASFSIVSAHAQSVLAAKSGLVHYIEGDVQVNGKAVSDKPSQFTSVPKDGELTTTLGRAEMLLTPGVFLRVAENSSVKMESASLDDTKVRVENGEGMVESDTPMKGNLVTMLYKDYAITFPKHGLYGLQTNPAQLKVYSGEAEVSVNGQTVVVHEGHLLPFTAALTQERFDPKQGDSLYRWSKLRSESLSIANISAAKQSGHSYLSGYNAAFGGNWFYNPFYGLYTYVPLNGIAFSPFGFGFYSPGSVWQLYNYNPYAFNNYSNLSPTATNTRSNSTPSSIVTSNSSSSSSGSLGGSRGGAGGFSAPGGHAGSGHSH